jgi:hypothetical protein
MKRFLIALLLGLIMTLLIILLGGAVAFLRLLASGHGPSETLSDIYVLTFLGKGWKIALVGGVVIFLLSIIGGPRSRSP